MKRRGSRGSVYRCPVCGAEITALARRHGRFEPRCCNVKMAKDPRRLAIYVCPVCGAEIGMLTGAPRGFEPRCCNVAMQREAA